MCVTWVPMSPMPAPSVSPEPSHIASTRAKVASRLSLLTLAVGLALFLVDRLTGVPLQANSLMTLGLAGMGLASWWLLKTQRYGWVAWLLVSWLFAMAAASTYLYGSVRTSNNALIPVGLVAVGLFFSHRALIGATVSAVALLGLLTLADATGLLAGQPDFGVGWRNWVTYAGCIGGAAAMMYLNRSQARMAQEAHLREAQRRLTAMEQRDIGQERFVRCFRSSPAALFVQSTRNGLIIDVNAAFEQLTGYRREQVVGRRDGFLWQADAFHEAFMEKRRSSRFSDWQPLRLACFDGQMLDVYVCCERDDDPEDGLAITAIQVPGGLVNLWGGVPEASGEKRHV